MKKLRLFLFALGLLTVFVMPVTFANNLYQVNLIVFKHMSALHSENWKHEFLKPDLKYTIELTEPNEPSNAYTLLPENKRGLRTEASILRRHHYQVLLYVSWVQEIKRAKYMRWVHIFGGNLYGQNIHELDGCIKISRNRFFNVNTKLYLTLPQSALRHFGSSLQTFHLIENRRTALNKINYLDHPLFGMLVQITPYAAL
jgi:hypothetical protein